MSEPLISIIIPVLNGENFLERCFATLEDQNYSRMEIIFVDNNSTDQSIRLIKCYCQNKINAQLFYCKKQGPGAARNVGLIRARGEYFSFLDVDDSIFPDKHLILLDALKTNPQAGMALGRIEKRYEDGKSQLMDTGTLDPSVNSKPNPGLLWLQQFQHNPAIHSFIINRKVWEKVGGFPENLKYGEDVAFSVKIGLETNVVLIEQVIGTYYRHSTSAVTLAGKNISIVERYFQFHEKFALPYFYEKRTKEPFNKAYELSKKLAFKMLMNLIIKEKNVKYKLILQNFKNNNYLPNMSLYEFIFFLFPFKFANYIYQKLNKI